MQVRRMPGTALANDATADIIYTPPEGEDRIRGLLANWERFLHGEDDAGDLDPLVRMAAAHYQFEAIHPFTDGNGRTGRILNLLMLVEQGLLDQPVLYLSRYIIRNKSAYYDGLLAVTTTGRWEPWLLFMLRAVEETAEWTLAKIAAVRTLIEDTADYARKAVPKQYSRELVDLIFVQPYCRIENVVEAGIAKRQTASVYLHSMAEVGLLQEEQVGLNKLFLNTRFLNLLTREPNSYPRFG
jgi:Fic family protein